MIKFFCDKCGKETKNGVFQSDSKDEFDNFEYVRKNYNVVGDENVSDISYKNPVRARRMSEYTPDKK